MLFRTKAQLLWRVFLSQATLFPQQVEAVYRLRGRTEVGLGSGQGLASCSEVRLCGADRLLVLGFFSCATVQCLCDILGRGNALLIRSEEHTSELQSLMRISYDVLCLKTKKKNE